jgi:DNA-binding SARP family transcriptional activator|tara:strand:+ start:149 stop:367 length:219 start_codon:yes stop_codon:yes gene_type:complete
MKIQDKVYQEILEHVLRLLSEHHSIEMIAGCLMAIAQRLYRTHLSKEDYNKIMQVAQEIEVEPYDLKKGTLH